jgi:putative ABC transport system permease protein
MRVILRGLRRQPAFSLLAILTLALGIGINVAIFSALEAVVLHPLPLPNAERLVAVYEDASWIGYTKNTPAPANFFDWKREAKSFDDMAATSGCRAVLTGDGAPEEVPCRSFAANIWPLFGVKPILGRWYTEEEDHPQPDVVMIGEGLWRRRFGGDPTLIGRTIQVNGRGSRVVGVMPRWFHFYELDLWMPLGLTAERKATRGSHFLTCYGRLKPGITPQQAETELRAIQSRLNRMYPKDSDPRLGATVEPLRTALVGETRTALWVLMGAAAMVLAIACANVANLLLARATGRQREIAVRSALGASAGDLLKQVFLETLALTGAGGAAGVALALATRKLLENFVPQALKGAVEISLDGRVLIFAVLVGLAAAALAALAPILHVLRTPPVDLLREDSRTGYSRSTVRLRGMLVAGEVALTVALLAGAGLMVRSLLAIWQTDLGFQPHNLMTVRVSLPNAKYADSGKQWQFYERALEKIRAIPSVAAADFVSTPPFFSIGNSRGFAIEGRTPGGQWEKTDMLTRAATPAYLQTIGATLLEGRFFSGADRDGGLEGAIVNQTFARVFFPNASPVGHRMTLTDGKENQKRWRVIVGVVKNVNERGYDRDPKPVTYLAVQQSDYTLGQLIVRTTQSMPAGLLNALRTAIQQVDPDQPLGQARTFDEVLALDQANRRQQMFLLALFAVLSLALACLGIYAILSYTVELRRHEIGVRMALGARSGDVIRMIAADGMKLAGAGAAAGIALTAAGARLLAASLYGVKPFDPLTLAAVCAVLSVVALLACWVPAHRAASTAIDGAAWLTPAVNFCFGVPPSAQTRA